MECPFFKSLQGTSGKTELPPDDKQQTAQGEFKGKTVVETPEEKPAYERNVHPQAVTAFNLAATYMDEGKRDLALGSLKDAADLGYAQAQYVLGVYYMNAGNNKEAFPCFLEAAQQDHPEGHYSVAAFTEKTDDPKEIKGIESDPTLSIRCLIRAAELGAEEVNSPKTHHNLGARCYFQNRHWDAFDWFAKSAKANDKDGLNALAWMYQQGEPKGTRPVEEPLQILLAAKLAALRAAQATDNQ